MNRKTFKKNNGITLVALIITVIVLIIISGITFNALKGEKNTIKEAEAANETAEEISAKEKVKAAVLAAKGKGDVIDLAKLNQKLGTSVTALPAIVQIEDINITISENGIVGGWCRFGDTISDGKSTLNIGDYINFVPDTVTLTSESQIIKDLQEYSGYVDTEYNTESTLSQENLGWRVFDVDENGQIELISSSLTTSKINLRNFNGYNNSVYLLDEVCGGLYSNSKYGIARNLKIEDIQNVINYDYTQYIGTTGQFGTEKEYNINETTYLNYPNISKIEKSCIYIDDERSTMQEGISEQKDLLKGRGLAEKKLKLKQTIWTKELKNNDFYSTKQKELLINGTDSYWLSSRGIDLHNDQPFYTICIVDKNTVTSNTLYLGRGTYSARAYGMRPLVTLYSNVQIDLDSGNGLSQSTAYNLK